ncbi:hypothetical protein D7004_06695 [Pedobacter jejuensis]|uniref:Uncharacterized protein n=1 Tax=Pedobacter jejuensis TaxID=1268550 RepID=A0A3N0BXL2_9SPHI|nr:hypothetical protein D7004_06695 [Pedobacter jejuensis]
MKIRFLCLSVALALLFAVAPMKNRGLPLQSGLDLESLLRAKFYKLKFDIRRRCVATMPIVKLIKSSTLGELIFI